MATVELMAGLREAEINWDEWVSASRTRNYMLDDPILDWLDYYALDVDGTPRHGHHHGFIPDNDPSSATYLAEADFLAFIMNKGIKFEDAVLAILEEKLDNARQRRAVNCIAENWLVTVCKSYEDRRDPVKLSETMESMRRGIPVISQGLLWDCEERTYGSPDLMVRSDALPLIFTNTPPYNATLGAPFITSEQWHYVIVDIKFCTLHLNSTGDFLRASDHAPYLAQVGLYNNMLGKMQGLPLTYGFLLGRGCEYSFTIEGEEQECRFDNCFERAGVFPMVQGTGGRRRDWLAEAIDAVAWVRRMRTEGHLWAPEDTIPQLLPNMGNSKDQPWHGAKRRIADQVGELTLLWQMSAPLRDDYHDRSPDAYHPGRPHPRARLCRWDDDWISAAVIGVTGPTMQPRLQAVIDAQKGCSPVCPERITWGDQEWREQRRVEFFVDFETFNSLDDSFTELPNKGGLDLVFMIGCGHFETAADGRREWKFNCFAAERVTPDEELRIFREWCDHMAEVKNRLDPNGPQPLVYHWSPAETTWAETGLKAARERHGDLLPEPPRYYDFLNLVVKPKKDTPNTAPGDCVAVKGALAFGLKSFGRALRELGHIQAQWRDGPTDGLGAMVAAWWCYRTATEQGISVFNVRLEDDGTGRRFPVDRHGAECRELFKLVAEYNEVDCKVMQECIDYLRKCH